MKDKGSMLVVNRENFMAWTCGNLLERDSDGKCLIWDSVRHEEVEDLLDKGERVGLADDRGKITSYLILEDEVYVEKVWEEPVA